MRTFFFFACSILAGCSSSVVVDGTGGASTSSSSGISSSSGPICGGDPLPCEVCNAGWECNPNDACLQGCPAVACSTCPGVPISVPGCDCNCDANGQLVCTVTDGCCASDMDCGDESFVPCVNGVCKMPVPDGCWVDAECPPGSVCVGAAVCSCGSNCIQPDQPGVCKVLGP